jgi:hypothetical protein
MTNPPQGSDEPAEWPGAPYTPPQHSAPQQHQGPQRHQGQTQPYSSQPYGPPQPGPGFPYGPPPPFYGPPGQSPQYGAPQYGAYGQPAPPTKSRVGLIAAVTAGILVLIAGAVVLASSLSSTVLDRNAVEADVAAQFEEREGVALDLSCAEEMTVESGATYECTGTTADGEDVTLRIAVADENTAAYTWTEP